CVASKPETAFRRRRRCRLAPFRFSEQRKSRSLKKSWVSWKQAGKLRAFQAVESTRRNHRGGDGECIADHHRRVGKVRPSGCQVRRGLKSEIRRRERGPGENDICA